MPKLLLYITLKGTWIFLIFGTDSNENRIHVHVGRHGRQIENENDTKMKNKPRIQRYGHEQ